MRSRKSKIAKARLLVLALILTTVVFGPQFAHADNCTSGGSGANGFAGKSKAEASELSTSGTCLGQAEPPEDWYKFTFDAPTSLFIQFGLAGSGATLYSPTAPTTPVQPNQGSGDQAGWSLHAAKGVWYLKIIAPFGLQSLQYEFHYATRPQSDCGAAAGDAANTSAGATEYFATFNSTCTGQLWGNPDGDFSKPPRIDTDDWFLLSGQTGGFPRQFTIAVTPDRLFGCAATSVGACGSPDGTGVKIEFRNSAGAVVKDDAGNASNTAFDNQGVALISFTPPADGDYKMHLWSNGDYIYDITPQGVPPVAQAVASQVAGVQSTIANATNLASATATASAVQSQVAGATGIASSLPLGDPGLLNPLGDCGSATGDASNNSSSPTQVGPGLLPLQCLNKLGAPGDNDDWFIFPVEINQQITLLVSGDGRLDPNVKLFDRNGYVAFDGKASSPIPETFTAKAEVGGNWKLHIRRQANAGTYLLLLDVRALPTDVSAVTSQVAGAQSTAASMIANAVPSNIPGTDSIKGDCQTAKDAGNTSSNPWKIQPNSACAGILGIPTTDADDWYSFQGTKGQTIVVMVQGETSLEQDAFLWNNAGQRIWPPVHFNSPLPELFSYTLTGTGTWKVQIHKNTGAGRYLFLLGNSNSTSIGGVPTITPPTVSNPAAADCGSGTDAPNSLVTARRVTVPMQCVGYLGGTDGDDFFSFPATVGNHIIVQEQADASLDADVFIYSPLGERTPAGPAKPGVTPENIYMYANTTGIYVIRIHKAFGSGNYQFSLYVGA